MQLFDYQVDCLEAIDNARLGGENKALVVMATGLGKTVVSAYYAKWLFEQIKRGRVLYLCHQNDILRQARETFEEILGGTYTYGFFHGQEKHLHHVDVLFASFQTMVKNRELFRRREFKYVIIDEGHHSHAETYRPTVQYFKPAFLLGLTATPERGDGRDITEIFGKPVYELGLFAALAENHLCKVDYRIMTDEIQHLEMLDTPIGKLSIAELNRTLFIPKRDEEIVRIIRQKTAKIKNPRVMIFSSSIEHTKRLAAMPGLNKATVLHSKLPHYTRRERLERFRLGKTNTILTVDMLNEGVDVPDVNVIVFLRSTSSRTIFMQQLGRGLRKAKGKQKVLVLDFVANCERIEMIDYLVEGTKKVLPPTGPVGDGDTGPKEEPLTLTLDGAKFDERVFKLVDVVKGIRKGYTREALTEQLLRKSRELGRSPSIKDVNSDPNMASITPFYDMFQTTSWSKVLKEVGLQPYIVADYDPEVLMDQLLEKAKLLGRTPKRSEVNDDPNMVGALVFQRVFNVTSWNAVILKAGLATRRHRGISRDQLIRQMQLKAEELGRPPKFLEVRADSHMVDPETFKKVFGTSWNGVLRATGQLVNRQDNRGNIEELRKQLLHKASVIGKTPTRREVDADPDMASSGTFINNFGVTWNGVLKAVGLKPTLVRNSVRAPRKLSNGSRKK